MIEQIIPGVSGRKIAGGGNLWFMSYLNMHAGERVETHKHQYDHVSLLSTGRARVDVAGLSVVYCAPNLILIRKDYEHGITALEDGTNWLCIHVARNQDDQPAMLDEVGVGSFEGLRNPLEDAHGRD